MKKSKKILLIVGIVLLVIKISLGNAYFITDNYDLRIASDMLNWPFWIVMFIAVFLPNKPKQNGEQKNDNDNSKNN